MKDNVSFFLEFVKGYCGAGSMFSMQMYAVALTMIQDLGIEAVDRFKGKSCVELCGMADEFCRWAYTFAEEDETIERPEWRPEDVEEVIRDGLPKAAD